MKAYKVAHDMKFSCFLGKKHDVVVNETYQTELVIHDRYFLRGFQFWNRMSDIHVVDIKRNMNLLEIEVLGKVETNERPQQLATDKFRIVRIVPREEWEFLRGNTILSEEWNGIVNDCGDVTYIKFTGNDGPAEVWRSYDSDGTCRECIFTHKGKRAKYKYDSDGRVIYTKNFEGSEEWSEYHEGSKKKKAKHTKDSSGFETWWEYDEFQRATRYKDSKGNERYDGGKILSFLGPCD